MAKKQKPNKTKKRIVNTKKRNKTIRSKIKKGKRPFQKAVKKKTTKRVVAQKKEPLELVILFKVTSRSRPDKFKRAINNIIENCNNTAYYILASADTEDHTMNNPEMIQFCTERNVLLMLAEGNGKTKIDAINRDINNNPHLPKWDILVNVSDDQYFIVKGFDDVIREDFEKNIPDLDGILHYPDGNRKDLMTMSIIGFPYYNRFKRIYFNRYTSVYCDDDAMNEAKVLGRHLAKKMYAFCDRQILVHAHPAFQKAEWDDMYRKNEAKKVHEADKRIFEWRKLNNFDIK